MISKIPEIASLMAPDVRSWPSITRRFLLCLVWIGMPLVLATRVAADASPEPVKPMNLLVIQTDEHNFRTLGCYRNTLLPEQALIWGEQAVVHTPAIDSIAKRGVLCTSFYATSPVCTPSRASFFTGFYPHRTGSPANGLPLKNEMVTFADVLRRQGYATGYAGKWHLDGSGKPQWAPHRQFGFSDNRFMFNRGHWKQFELTATGPRVAARNPNDQPIYSAVGATEKSFSTDWLTTRAIHFIQENADRPFCFHLSLPDPHGPNTVRSPYNTMYNNLVIKPPRTFLQKSANPKWAPGTGKGAAGRFRAEQMAQYFGMVRCIDDNVARLLETLEQLELLQQTFIVFTSDHGDLCYEHGRLNKGNPYEGSARIPMVVAAPGRIPPGRIVESALGTVDFAPTILSLLNAFPDDIDWDGRDAARLFRGEDVEWSEATILRNAGRSCSWVAAVTDRYKLVISVDDGPWLFDLQDDPDELQNAFREHGSEIQQKLAADLIRYGEQFQDPYISHAAIRPQLIQISADR